MRRSAALLPPLLAMSCFQPELVSGRYRCDRPQDSCPKDFVCHNGLCLDPAQVPDSGGAEDLSMPKPDNDLRREPDMRTPTPDMRTPTPDMRTECTLVAKEKASEVLACRLTFTGGLPMDSCPSGTHVCDKDDDAALAKVDTGMGGAVNCSALGGFYAAAIQAAVKIDKANEVVCESSNEEGGWALVGCGSEPGLGAEPATRRVTNECRKLKIMLPCNVSARSWSCTQKLSGASHDDKHPGGVLCCK